ncbi:MAG: glycosyltransferase family 4 protein [Candidatus Eremiobacteraeota bacterium]|nr:glycosyltransferase family 4 protein [Candidatus Eremiobacteraeota bacterium]
MKVAIDAQLTVGSATGIGEYVSGLIGALQARDVQVTILREPRLDPWRFDRRLLWDQVLLPLSASRSGADLLHCASGTMPVMRRLPSVITVHDVAWLRAQEHARAYARYYFGEFSAGRYERATRVIVDSSFSKEELLACTRVDPSRVDVVHPGVANDYFSIVRSRKNHAFILAVGTIERRKNLEVLIRALSGLDRQVRLVVVGPGTEYEAYCRDLASSLRVADRVDWRGYIPRATLLDLFAHAAVVAVPSLYEGFGYAAAQALCAGAPVIVSDAPSLVEVVAGRAPVLAAGDSSAWTEQLNAIVSNADAAENRARAVRDDAMMRFSWRVAAAQTCEVYQKALAA